MRVAFVERVSKPVISALLDELLAQKVLGLEEVDEVQDRYTVRTDKARCLIDTVRLKGPRASQIFINILRKRDGALAEQLGLGADSGERCGAVVCPRPCWGSQCLRWDAGGGLALASVQGLKARGSWVSPMSLLCVTASPLPCSDDRALRGGRPPWG